MISMLSKHFPKCKGGKTLAASIDGAPVPKELDVAPVEESKVAAAIDGKARRPNADSQEGQGAPHRQGRPSDKTVADLARCRGSTIEEGDGEDRR